MNRLFLCSEFGEMFYIDSENLKTATVDAAIWGASVVMEIPRKFQNVNPYMVVSKLKKLLK